MSGFRARSKAGCLFIDDAVFNRQEDEGLWQAPDIPDVELRPFRCANARGLWDQLQAALQEIRAEWGAGAIMATGEGCAAALALACQLPVDRIVLVDPGAPADLSRLRRQGQTSPDSIRLQRVRRRLAGYARRNLPLCVSDMLIVGHEREGADNSLRRAYGNPVNCRVERLLIPDNWDKELYTIREIAVKEAISRFLHPFESTKPLAENPEMCIIYG